MMDFQKAPIDVRSIEKRFWPIESSCAEEKLTCKYKPAQPAFSQHYAEWLQNVAINANLTGCNEI